MNFICWRFGTPFLFHFHRQVRILRTYLPMKMEQTERSEMSAYKIQTPGNYAEESIQYSEHGESLLNIRKNSTTACLKETESVQVVPILLECICCQNTSSGWITVAKLDRIWSGKSEWDMSWTVCVVLQVSHYSENS